MNPAVASFFRLHDPFLILASVGLSALRQGSIAIAGTRGPYLIAIMADERCSQRSAEIQDITDGGVRAYRSTGYEK